MSVGRHSRARTHLAQARRKRALAQDANGDEQALAEADFTVSQALARVVLDEIEVNRARSRELEREGLELRIEGRLLLEMPIGPERGERFVELAVRAHEWWSRWKLFTVELAAIAATQH